MTLERLHCPDDAIILGFQVPKSTIEEHRVSECMKEPMAPQSSAFAVTVHSRHKYPQDNREDNPITRSGPDYQGYHLVVLIKSRGVENVKDNQQQQDHEQMPAMVFLADQPACAKYRAIQSRYPRYAGKQ